MFNNLFDKPPIGFILLSILLLFVVCVAIAILESIRPRRVSNANFGQVSLILAGLILSVASGVLGVAPNATVGPQPADGATTAATMPPEMNSTVRIDTPQIAAFKSLYTVVYSLSGILCLIVVILPTPATHDLVRTVAFSTLGFASVLVPGTLGANNTISLTVQLKESPPNAFSVPETPPTP